MRVKSHDRTSTFSRLIDVALRPGETLKAAMTDIIGDRPVDWYPVLDGGEYPTVRLIGPGDGVDVNAIIDTY